MAGLLLPMVRPATPTLHDLQPGEPDTFGARVARRPCSASAPPARFGRQLGWMILLLALHWVTLARVGAAPAVRKAAPAWEDLEACKLDTAQYHDGDSFHIRQGNREFVLRLYCVDAPETSRDFPDRVREQADAFGLSEAQTLLLGSEAREYVVQRLGTEPFRVVTRWEQAPGMSAQARYYGFVLMGRNQLALDLVRQGLARVHGKCAGWPTKDRAAAFHRQLRSAEQRAREKHAGAWNPRLRRIDPERGLIDINRATLGELDQLPGIGPALARRIVAARPFASVEELERVPGIGTGRIEALRERVTVGGGRPSRGKGTAARPGDRESPEDRSKQPR